MKSRVQGRRSKSNAKPLTCITALALGAAELLSGFCLSAAPVSGAESQTSGGPAASRAQHIRVNRELTWSMLENLITLKEYRVARSVLEEHLRVDPLDGRSWLLMGHVDAGLGQTQESEKAIRRGKKILNGSEDRMVRYAEAELALAKGNRGGAKAKFAALASGDDALAEKARRALPAFEAKNGRSVASISGVPGLVEPKVLREIPDATNTANASDLEPAFQMPWSANLNLSLLSGYDANILQISDSIAPSAAGLGSFYSTAGLQGVFAGSGLGGVLSVSGSLGYTYNFAEIASGLNNLSTSAGLQWSTPPSGISRVGFSMGWVTSGSFMESGGYGLYALSSTLQPTLAVRISDSVNMDWSVNGGINQFPGVELTSTQDDRSGTQAGTNLGVRSLIGSGQLGISFGYARQFATGDNFKTVSYNSALSYSRGLPWLQSTVNGTLSYSMVSYPLSDTSRNDRLASATVGWSAPFKIWDQKFQVSPSMNWSSSSSNVDSASFSKTALNLQVVYAIK